MHLRYPDPGHKSCGAPNDELGGRGHHTIYGWASPDLSICFRTLNFQGFGARWRARSGTESGGP